MREPVKKTISGVTFEVTPLGHAQGRRGFVRLAKVLGPALAAGAGARGKGTEDMSRALEGLAERLSDEDLEWFSEAFGGATRFSTDDPKKWPYLTEANRESLFQGRIVLFFEWLLFALEVNYSDFLEWFRRATNAAAPAENQTPDSHD